MQLVVNYEYTLHRTRLFSLTRSSSSSLRDVAAYPLAEVARYTHVPAATVRSWVLGRPYGTAAGRKTWKPIIKPSDSSKRLLSFNNLVEIHVLSALRTGHGTPVAQIRTAMEYAERELGIDRLLLHPKLLTDGRHMFLERYFELLNLSLSGQIAIKSLLDQYLHRVDRDERQLPMRLFPFVHGEVAAGPRHIAIDPNLAFGRPVVLRRNIATQVIADRIDAGESVEEIAADYDLERTEVEAAVVYERAA